MSRPSFHVMQWPVQLVVAVTATSMILASIRVTPRPPGLAIPGCVSLDATHIKLTLLTGYVVCLP
jgi:hypothetical protein